jgi:hypothetical protein
MLKVILGAVFIVGIGYAGYTAYNYYQYEHRIEVAADALGCEYDMREQFYDNIAYIKCEGTDRIVAIDATP